MKAYLISIKSLAENIKSLTFKSEEPLRYTAGQFIEVTLSHDNPDDRGVCRWFTLSSAPGQDIFTITTKFATDRSSSFKQAFHDLSPGDGIQISEPMGDFVLPKDATIPLVFVAAGIGVTPYHSMIEWLTLNKQTRQIELVYIAKPGESVFRKSFDIPFVNAHYLENKQKLTAQKIVDIVGSSSHKMIYLAGPEPMIEDIVTQFKILKVSSSQIVTDYFPGYLDA